MFSLFGKVEGYEEISAKEAKRIMDEEKGYVILDVRTKQEFNEGHIKGAVLIPNDQIRARAEKELKDKDQLILVYCRSGARAGGAGKDLARMGYTNVKNFGGIMSYKYDIEK